MRLPFALALLAALSLACGPTCPSGQVRCDDACVALDTDANHCGACATVCPSGASCSASLCQCPSGETACGASCTDTSSDAANCGTCGHDCGLGVCSNGACVCNSSPASILDCGGSPACVDTAADAKNCGACASACPLENEACSGGQCACAPTATECPVAAPTACVDLTSDDANCGSCGAACLAGGACSGGVCGCATPLSACPAAHPTACVNEATDADNCGACGAVCVSGQTCQSGVCCAGTVCGGTCVNPVSDVNNCGACGVVCGSAAPSCVSGACCGSGTTAVCGGACCGGGATCCASGGCQLQHYNGLGGPQGATFFDCNATDSLGAAQDAATAWAPSGLAPASQSTLTGQDCFGWETSDGTQCAVYCATGSAAPGLVKLTLNDLGCMLPYVGDPSSTSWE